MVAQAVGPDKRQGAAFCTHPTACTPLTLSKTTATAGIEIPWDLKKAQPALEKAEESGQIRGLVLDAGCGFGDNAIYLAQKGYKCVGFDFSAKAIEVAIDRAEKVSAPALPSKLLTHSAPLPFPRQAGRNMRVLRQILILAACAFLRPACLKCASSTWPTR